MNKLKCQICGFEGMNLVTHLKFKHFQSVDDYRKKYGQRQVYLHSDELRNKISNTLKKLNENIEFRRENSNRQKNGASCLTIKYWTNRGVSEENARIKISELQKNNCRKHLVNGDLQECSHFSTKYWIKRGCTEQEAIKNVYNIQSELSSKSSKFQGHIHTDEEKERISSSLKKMIDVVGRGKWARHFGEFNGRSKAEIEFYNYIKENIDLSVQANVSVGNYIVDVIKTRKIIEFYGDFWHANPLIFSKCNKLYPHGRRVMMAEDIWKKDNARISWLRSEGYEVLIVWETEWKKQKEVCIEKIRKYLL
jgi:G:T-mismatch repair DNA endonuclease (very short patch repair protein)